eukprot:CAMPEP_0118857160 /NCGR_PEP_ID=MMETSP1163-20130328/4375_1 /TAXON_ID=124430 /ORGANISM="Phaeomonas parva, Strain CCMP2877" /LENGTH=614 /DNA_ID=CAMNT_0006790421 /DNA_START=63 /DNA_END=1907 /DNA_ORIENTATION=-
MNRKRSGPPLKELKTHTFRDMQIILLATERVCRGILPGSLGLECAAPAHSGYFASGREKGAMLFTMTIEGVGFKVFLTDLVMEAGEEVEKNSTLVRLNVKQQLKLQTMLDLAATADPEKKKKSKKKRDHGRLQTVPVIPGASEVGASRHARSGTAGGALETKPSAAAPVPTAASTGVSPPPADAKAGIAQSGRKGSAPAGQKPTKTGKKPKASPQPKASARARTPPSRPKLKGRRRATTDKTEFKTQNPLLLRAGTKTKGAAKKATKKASAKRAAAAPAGVGKYDVYKSRRVSRESTRRSSIGSQGRSSVSPPRSSVSPPPSSNTPPPPPEGARDSLSAAASLPVSRRSSRKSSLGSQLDAERLEDLVNRIAEADMTPRQSLIKRMAISEGGTPVITPGVSPASRAPKITFPDEWATYTGNVKFDFDAEAHVAGLLRNSQASHTNHVLSLQVAETRPTVRGLRTTTEAKAALHSDSDTEGASGVAAKEPHEVTFVFGDMGAHVDCPGGREELVWMVREGAPESLSRALANDSLQRGHLLEGEITFKPTATFRPDSADFHAKRSPSWPDRILYKVRIGNAHSNRPDVQQFRYASLPDLAVSEHRPVLATFHIELN